MLKGKCEMSEVPKNVLSSSYWKNINEQKQSKMLEWEPRKIKKKKLKKTQTKRVEMKMKRNKKGRRKKKWPSREENDPWSESPWNIIWTYLSFLSEPRT